MPTYEYACGACGHQFEVVQSIKDDPINVCEQCGAPEAKRQISLGGGFILKGGGWYSDLYGSSKAKASDGSSSSSSGTSSSSSTSGSSGGTSSSSSTSGSSGGTSSSDASKTGSASS